MKEPVCCQHGARGQAGGLRAVAPGWAPLPVQLPPALRSPPLLSPPSHGLGPQGVHKDPQLSPAAGSSWVLPAGFPGRWLPPEPPPWRPRSGAHCDADSANRGPLSARGWDGNSGNKPGAQRAGVPGAGGKAGSSAVYINVMNGRAAEKSVFQGGLPAPRGRPTREPLSLPNNLVRRYLPL